MAARSDSGPASSSPALLSVEVLGPEQWERWRAIRLRSLADAPDAFWSTVSDEEHLDEAAWRERLSRETTSILLAVRDGHDVGCAVPSVHYLDKDVAGMYAMWVAPEARGVGAGDALIEAVIVWARVRGFGVLRFDVTDGNGPAVALYARHGAVPTGRVDVFPAPREHLTEHELEITL